MTYCEKLKRGYKNSGIIVDTNLLILLLVGSFDKTQIECFKKTTKYTIEDYSTLVDFLQGFKIITTPNIITEITNLCDSLNKSPSYKFFKYISQIISTHNEVYIESKKIFFDSSFYKFGLTDSVIFHLAKNKVLVLTDDFPLFGYLTNKGLMAINFNHIRSDYMINK